MRPPAVTSLCGRDPSPPRDPVRKPSAWEPGREQSAAVPSAVPVTPGLGDFTTMSAVMTMLILLEGVPQPPPCPTVPLSSCPPVPLKTRTLIVFLVGWLHLGHSADTFIPSDLQQEHLSEESETIYRCRNVKDVHRNKCRALTIARLIHSLYATKIAEHYLYCARTYNVQ